MSKSSVMELEAVYHALFQDAKYTFPELTADFDRDEVRIQTAVLQRGIYALCVDLPAAGKYLVQALASGTYKPSGLPLTKKVGGGVVIPKLFRGLYLRIFHSNGNLKTEIDYVALRFLRQFLMLASKADLQCSDESIQAEMLEFVRVDSILPEPHPFWDGLALTPVGIQDAFPGFRKTSRYTDRVREGKELDARLPQFLEVLDTVSGILVCEVGPFKPTISRFRHGPGSVSNREKHESKYRWTTWTERLDRVFPIADVGYSNYANWVDDVDIREASAYKGICQCGEQLAVCQHDDDPDCAGWSSVEPYSRMVDVRKTFLKPRLIALEPSEHMWCQQAIWDHIRVAFRRSDWLGDFIAFEDQTLNQMLCHAGSIDGDLATVDLSRASDRISCHAIGCLFRSNIGLLEALMATRSRYVELSFPDGVTRRHKLKMFSTMGNACTFPVESIFFLSIALSATLVCRGLAPTLENIRSLIGEVSVFGDDIIIPTSATELLYDALHVLDCKVNVQKSFRTGRFRESCGFDAVDGVNVTPIYWKAPYKGKCAESYSQAVDTINNFYDCYLVNTAEYLRSTVRDVLPPLVAYDSAYVGIRTRGMVGAPPHVKCRWNRHTQGYEYLLPAVKAKAEVEKPTDAQGLLQFFTETEGAPVPFTKWTAGVNLLRGMHMHHQWVPHRSLTATRPLR